MMVSEDDYEDLSPICTDEPYLTLESEAGYLLEMARDDPKLSRPILEQIHWMRAYAEVEEEDRAEVRAMIADSRRRRDLSK